MKIIYAFRRGTFYPHQGTDLPSKETRPKFLKKAREIGFEGIELGTTVYDISGSREEAVRTLRKEMEDAGLPCVAIRGGGIVQKNLEEAVRFASLIGANFLNTTVSTPLKNPEGKGSITGESVSQGSSRDAKEEDFERIAKVFSEVAKFASELGITISIEIHQHSIADNSRSALHLLKLIDNPNVGVNPDLGNIYWTYNVPEESCEAAIVALAPHAKYWHCKNLHRVYFPELERAIFIQVPLPNGDIDYRFAVSAMIAAGYDGYIAVEGIRLGDQFYNDGKSVAYLKSLITELKSQ